MKYLIILSFLAFNEMAFADATCQEFGPNSTHRATITNYTDLSGEAVVAVKVQKQSTSVAFEWFNDIASTVVKRSDILIRSHGLQRWLPIDFADGHVAQSWYAKTIFTLEFFIEGDRSKRIEFDCEGTH